MPVWLIISATAVYMLGLFYMAWSRDREVAAGGFHQSPTIYALALAVYCTSWTYFGAVGTAASSGWEFLPIYAGPAIVFLFLPHVIRRIGDVARRESITSLSDFLSARYGKSRSVAAVATLAAVAGSLPYIALQLKSVGMSLQNLMQTGPEESELPANETVLVTAGALAVFAILFGARHSDTTKQNAGLMRVLAFEAVVKLAALLAVAILSTVILSRPELPRPVEFSEVFSTSTISGRFITALFLAMAAIICLPRQFHVAIIERHNDNDLDRARWVFPAYMVLTSLVVIPITLAGLSVLPPTVSPDLFVLELPISQGDGLLTLLVFLGGFSAATGMVIVSTIALSTMVTNDLIVPTILRGGSIDKLGGNSGARLIMIRRTVIIVLLLLAYGYYRLATGSAALAQIGLLSFAAAVQFVPALLLAIYWKGGRRNGVQWGIATGMALWSYTLFLPAIIGAEKMAAALPGWLDPTALFGAGMGDTLTHGAVWSLTANTLVFVTVSLSSRERLRDRIQAAVFTGESTDRTAHEDVTASLYGEISPTGLKTLAARFLAPDAVDHAFDHFERQTGIKASGDAPADWRLVQTTERLLASALGAPSARLVMSSAVGGVEVGLGGVLSLLESRTQAERFDRHMLQSMLENISQGISVVDHEQNLAAWNSAYVELFGYPPELVGVGQPISRLIRHNIERGWISGDPAEEANRRIEHMKTGRPHIYERLNPDGRWLRIAGYPMPGGGYVTTFTDITGDKQREAALIEANETLEARVLARTRDLEKMAGDLDIARQEAESANISKTRFLAAASHDLLQPLNAARLFLASIRTDAAEEAAERNRTLVAKVDTAIQSADALLKGLLDISRLDQTGETARPVTFPLAPMLEELVEEALPMAAKAGLEMRMAPTTLSVHADPDFLQSILRNFLSNARRYTQSGAILIGARRRGNQVRIEVWDTGPGIPEVRRSAIFNEFERIEEVDNLGIRGAGLGLSIASRLAALLGTSIEVRSREGHGSVFSVAVPRRADTQAATRGAAVRPPGGTARLKRLSVLCVDDEKTILDAMAALLSQWGCSVLTAESPETARKLVAENPVDVLIADLQLKHGANGLDLLLELGPQLPGEPRLALLTARADALIKSKARRHGIEFLQKPADPEQIFNFLAGGASAFSS